MDLFFLNKSFKPCVIIDSFNNLAWSRKYYETGSFSLDVISDDYKKIKDSEAKYLYCKDFKETAKLETLVYDDRMSTTINTLTGRFLENLLKDRVVKTTRSYKGTTEEIARAIVSDFCIDSDNPIENLQLGEYKGLGQSRVFQTTGGDIETTLYALLKLDELSYIINYDFENDKLTFEVWQGLDRTEEQDLNSYAVFSKNFENIKNDKYSIDETKYKNVAIVAGQGEGSDRTIVEVDKIKDGEYRKELYVDARDLQQEDGMSEEEYLEILKQRGEEELQKNNRVETTDFEIDSNSNLIYKIDYDLGDKVTYKNEDLELYVENRIVEIHEVFESNSKKIDVVFGEDYNIKKWMV